MAIDDFEWQGAAELTPPSQTRTAKDTSGGQGFWVRLTRSVWLEPALKLGGSALLLAVLAGIGVVATTYAKPGMKLPQSSQALVAALGTSWLKPTPLPDASAVHAALPSASAAERASENSAPAPTPTPSDAALAGVTADGKVILNQASAEELTKLPGVGLKRAQAIVALRTKLKRFKSPTELLRVKGIGPRGLQRMLPHLVLDAPP
jgi:competence protein ComEA